jgi:hypothetical protein
MFFCFRLGRLDLARKVLPYDVFDFFHDHEVMTRRFFNCRVRQTGIGGQIDIGQLTLKLRTGGDWLAEAILLIKIHQVEDILGHRLRPCCIESDDQFDRNILAVELIGNVKRGVATERMPDDNNDVSVPA